MRLILLRHAKSDWADAAVRDHDRPLNARGRRAAPLIGRWLAAHGHLPARVLCSTARRTRETLDLLALPATPTEFRPDLYLAAPRHIASLARGEGPLLVVGHNPGIALAAADLACEPPAHPDFERYPTGACTVLEMPSGAVVDFAIPRDLA
jgi:phosphohistidine phosphatase